MARSKQVTKKAPKPAEAPLTTKPAQGTPYQLDPAQLERAANALVAHMKKHAAAKQDVAATKDLMADDDDAEEVDQPIFLNIATKTHVHNTNRLKPTKIALPHPIIPADAKICIFTKDPQRAYKDLVASDQFPATLRPRISRVLGVEKLKKKFKSFEQKRALFADHDIFMVDDRVLKIVADFLGKVFYANKSKRPIPIRLTAGADKTSDNQVGTPQAVAREVETALNATYLSMSASANTSVRVGHLSLPADHLIANTAAVIAATIPKHVEHGWRNIRGLYLKGAATKALPIWLADELWVSDAAVLDEPYTASALTKGEGKTAVQKRKWESWEEEMLDDDELAEKRAKRDAKKAKKAGPTKKKVLSKDKTKALKEAAVGSVGKGIVA